MSGTKGLWRGTPLYPSIELDYVERATDASITAVSPATAQTVIALPKPISGDLGRPVWIEFYTALAQAPTGAANRFVACYLFEDGVSLGGLAYVQTPVNGTMGAPVHVRRRIINAGGKTYEMRAWVSAGTGTIYGALAAGLLPMYFRAEKVT